MALSNLLSQMAGKSAVAPQEIDKSSIDEHIDDYRRIIAYWRAYPDKFVDYLCSMNPDNKFKFYFIQRVFLRIVMRYRTVYATFSRGFSKSFLSVLALMLKAVLYPGASLITVADGKSQSAMILSSKIQEICELIPALAKEVEWDTKGKLKQTTQSKDSVTYAFRCGSQIRNLSMSANSRGARAHGVLTEEVATISDESKYEEIVNPMLVISRQVNGRVDSDEVLNQSAVFVTSAGYKGTYAYDKLIDTLCHMVADKKNNDAFILGGDWKVPVVEGLQPANFIQEQEMGNSMDEAGFEREYGSVWAGSAAGCFFNPSKFDQHRVLNLAEVAYNKGISARGFYVMGVDVGRFGDMTEVVIIKVAAPSNQAPIKQVVNIFTFEAAHFETQAIKIKKVFNDFKCDICVLDGNGVGAGLVDFLVRDQIDPETDEPLYNWGVYNDEDRKYRDWQTPDTIQNALYIMKANAPLNSEMYAYCQAQLNSGKLKFLIDESVAKNKLMAQKQGQSMSPAERELYLRPYVETTILKSQMMNLVQENEGANIILKKVSAKIKKDKFSALIYGLYWCKLKEEKSKKRRGRNFSGMMLFTKH